MHPWPLIIQGDIPELPIAEVPQEGLVGRGPIRHLEALHDAIPQVMDAVRRFSQWEAVAVDIVEHRLFVKLVEEVVAHDL